MKTSTTTAAAALVAAMVAFVPVTAAPGPSTFATKRQAEEWEGDENGNVWIEIGDTKFRWGSALPSAALDVIDEACGETGCRPGEPYRIPSLRIDSNHGTESAVVMQVEGNFSPAGTDGDKAQLISIAKEVMYKAFDEGVHTLEQDALYFDRPCQQTPQNGCVYPDPLYADQWFATNHLVVTVRDNDMGLNSYLNIAFAADGDGGSSGLCSGLMGLGSAVAGAIPGLSPASGILFSVASVGCNYA
ncbi:hypothetical protein ACHAQA_006168 [Verticillium albo-atrum]